jgi:hypothetical protein
VALTIAPGKQIAVCVSTTSRSSYLQQQTSKRRKPTFDIKDPAVASAYTYTRFFLLLFSL